MFLPFTGASLKGNTVSAVNGPVSILRTPMEMVLDPLPLPLALFCDCSLTTLLFSLPLRRQNEGGFLFWFAVVITK
ncbi:hypothetical protein OIU77_019304 [Salix suchowensis]|uniref:Uncharacterized protein n=1 Tax=Salix suchowensis TaxID=1278906 RepID=A0ABQ9CFS9_9ROSI|nr:hypothetical protein OIU77_019304 [Salix suchowensis]